MIETKRSAIASKLTQTEWVFELQHGVCSVFRYYRPKSDIQFRIVQFLSTEMNEQFECDIHFNSLSPFNLIQFQLVFPLNEMPTEDRWIDFVPFKYVCTIFVPISIFNQQTRLSIANDKFEHALLVANRFFRLKFSNVLATCIFTVTSATLKLVRLHHMHMASMALNLTTLRAHTQYARIRMETFKRIRFRFWIYDLLLHSELHVRQFLIR